MLAETAHQWERLIVLAPVFVIGVGLVLAVIILLVRAFLDSVSEVKHKQFLWIGAGALVAVVVLLTYLGVNLPKE
jgi:hypothetical protein